MYNVIRFYREHPTGIRRRTILQRVTLEQAQTSSTTGKGRDARRRTKRIGAWFDGYEER